MPNLFRNVFAAAGLTVSVALISGPGLADMPITYKDEGRSLFHVSVPDFWTVRAGGGRAVTPPGSDEARLINRVIGLTPVSADGIWMGFISPHGVRTYEQALEYLRGVGPFLVENAEVQERKRISIGGLPAARLTGSGSRDGKSVNFTAVVVDLPSDRVAISVVVMEAGVNPDLVSDVNAVFASFRAVR
jgi:hypothetical protein